MDVSSQAWEWAKYGTAAGLGALLLALLRFYLDRKRLPSEIHRTHTESLRIEAEAGKTSAEAKKIGVESEVALSQAVFEMTKQVIAENKNLRSDLEGANKTIEHLIQQANAKERARLEAECAKDEALMRVGELEARLKQLDDPANTGKK